MYDLVRDTPSHVIEQLGRRFGGLRAALLLTRTLDLPFFSTASFRRLAEETPFKEGDIGFVGILCCLVLKKDIPDIVA